MLKIIEEDSLVPQKTLFCKKFRLNVCDSKLQTARAQAAFLSALSVVSATPKIGQRPLRFGCQRVLQACRERAVQGIARFCFVVGFELRGAEVIE